MTNRAGLRLTRAGLTVVALSVAASGCSDGARSPYQDPVDKNAVSAPTAEPGSSQDPGRKAPKRKGGCVPTPRDRGRLLIYFTCVTSNAPEAVGRPVRVSGDAASQLRHMLQTWLAGPTEEEKRAGLIAPSVTPGRHRVSVSFRGHGRVVVDFSDGTFQKGGLSGTQVIALLDPLRVMMFEESALRTATLTVEGDCEAFWELLERGCMPLTPSE